MKHVTKLGSPAEFEAWKALENEDWKPTYDSLRNPQKKAVHQALLEEQGWVCCYCGRAISQANSHIEHFKPQESHEDLALDFTNLHASCIRESDPGMPLHCGHAKGNAFDESTVISPLDRDCEKRFRYALDGRILPNEADDEAAVYMTSLLRLDLEFLRNRRLAVLSEVFDPQFIASATNEELAKLVDGYQQRDRAGRLENFGHVVARFAEQLLGV
jgi:uncharacterized protein (TIGR02646 family)